MCDEDLVLYHFDKVSVAILKLRALATLAPCQKSQPFKQHHVLFVL